MFNLIPILHVPWPHTSFLTTHMGFSVIKGFPRSHATYTSIYRHTPCIIDGAFVLFDVFIASFVHWDRQTQHVTQDVSIKPSSLLLSTGKSRLHGFCFIRPLTSSISANTESKLMHIDYSERDKIPFLVRHPWKYEDFHHRSIMRPCTYMVPHCCNRASWVRITPSLPTQPR